MLFPYGTDAPVYHWPFITVAMIVANVVIFVLEFLHPGLAEWLCLQTGSGLHPYQWLTSNFAHVDFVHILGNMIFLWSFGLVVEGKLGWWRTLAVYLGVGIVYGAAVQLLMLAGPESRVLGASAIVYAFMAMSLIWAPQNSLQCVLILFFRPILCEFTIATVVVFFLALQVLFLCLNQMALSTELLHMIGSLAGLGVGIWMLKTNRVDCENWDLFSVIANRRRMTEKERIAEAVNDPKYIKQQADRTKQRAEEALEWIREQLQGGNCKAALEVYRHVSVEQPKWILPKAEHYSLIAGLLKSRLTADAIPLMGQYLTRYPNHAIVMRLKLAEALLCEKRPAQAMKVLAKLPKADLDLPQRDFLLRLRKMAHKLHQANPYEIADEDW